MAVISLLAIVSGAVGGLSQQPFIAWVLKSPEEVCLAAPAIIATARGRKCVRFLLLGKLTLAATIGLGLAAGCACVLFSTIIDLPYYTWPMLDLHGLFKAFGAPPVTAYLLGPFGEEMFFQVGVQTWLQRFGPIVAVLATTAPFLALHLYGGFVAMHDAIFQLLPSFIVFAVIRQTTKSFGAALVAHSTCNVLVSSLTFFPR